MLSKKGYLCSALSGSSLVILKRTKNVCEEKARNHKGKTDTVYTLALRKKEPLSRDINQVV